MMLKPILEVIARDHECADTRAISQALALGFIYERSGKLYLTASGKRLLTSASSYGTLQP